jgi:hypothetical protein
MNTIPITLDAFCSVWTSSVFMLAALSSSWCFLISLDNADGLLGDGGFLTLTVYLLIKQAKKCQKGKHKGKLMIRRSLSRKPIRRRPYVRFQSKLTTPNGSVVENAEGQFTPMMSRKTN